VFGLKEINLYPHLNWFFYTILTCLLFKYRGEKEKLYYLFITSLILESAFIIDVGFFVKVNHLVGILLILLAARLGFDLPSKFIGILSIYYITAIFSVAININLTDQAALSASRVTFLRPVIQLSQFSVLALIMVSVVSFLKKFNNLKQTVQWIHLLSIIVALYAIYEVLACFLHLPFINLNNDLPSYWYLGIDSNFPMFRPRSTFYEPINLNNFQFFAIACSLIYKQLADKKGITYWGVFVIQLAVLLISFSRSTLLIIPVTAIIFFCFYPENRPKTLPAFLVGRFFKFISIVIVSLAFFSILYSSNFLGIKETQTLKKVVTGRFRDLPEQISIAGRKNAIIELKKLYNDNRFVFGFGMGNEFNWRPSGTGVTSFYNQIFLYTGVVGLMLFAIFLFLILFQLFRNGLHLSKDLTYRKINIIYFVGLLSMLTHRLSFAGFLTDTYLWSALAIGIYIGYFYQISYTTKKTIICSMTT